MQVPMNASLLGAKSLAFAPRVCRALFNWLVFLPNIAVRHAAGTCCWWWRLGESQGLVRRKSDANRLVCYSKVAHARVLELVARHVDAAHCAQMAVANVDINVHA